MVVANVGEALLAPQRVVEMHRPAARDQENVAYASGGEGPENP